MICVICCVNETDNPDSICDDCKTSMFQDDGMGIGMEKKFD